MVTRPAALVAQSSTPSPFVAPQAVKSDPSNSGCCARKEKLASGFRQRRSARSARQVATSCPCTTRSEEHTSELQSLMRISYAVFCLKKKKKQRTKQQT